MSQIRTYVDGRPTWRKADDGATPHLSVSGIRGSVGEPVFGVFVTGTGPKSGAKAQAEYKAREKARAR